MTQSDISQERFHVVIPARYASQRLPGKPLQTIGGRPMVQWVVERAISSRAQTVVVATDDERIATAVNGFGGEAVLTRTDHVSGTDRLWEVAAQKGWSDDTVVVNLQGDEPGMSPTLIRQVAAALAETPEAGVSTLGVEFDSRSTWTDPNVVKVVRDEQGRALYFSRAPIPFMRDESDPVSWPGGHLVWRHLGLYAYRVAALRGFTEWSPGHLELAEKLEQLRFLANGVPVVVSRALVSPGRGVDTQIDLDAVRAEAAQWTR